MKKLFFAVLSVLIILAPFVVLFFPVLLGWSTIHHLYYMLGLLGVAGVICLFVYARIIYRMLLDRYK